MRSVCCPRILRSIEHLSCFRDGNEAVSALICGDAVSDAASGALSFPPYNVAFRRPFLRFIKIAFVCFADLGSASDALSDVPSDALIFLLLM